jgi:hypothetical protein
MYKNYQEKVHIICKFVIPITYNTSNKYYVYSIFVSTSKASTVNAKLMYEKKDFFE